jgi:hypothetical protein
MIQGRTKNGDPFWVDDQDAWVLKYKWRSKCLKTGGLSSIVHNASPRGKAHVDKRWQISLHHLIIMTDRWIDHKDGNPANNTRDNLRECTCRQNRANSRGSRTSMLGIKGVYRCKSGFYALIVLPGKRKRRLGTFQHVHEAREAYRKAAIELHGEFAKY